MTYKFSDATPHLIQSIKVRILITYWIIGPIIIRNSVFGYSSVWIIQNIGEVQLEPKLIRFI